MAHKILENGNVVVDWETGDKEGDRKYLFQAYREFIGLLIEEARSVHHDDAESSLKAINELLDRWKISIEPQVDEFPRIWISRPTV